MCTSCSCEALRLSYAEPRSGFGLNELLAPMPDHRLAEAIESTLLCSAEDKSLVLSNVAAGSAHMLLSPSNCWYPLGPPGESTVAKGVVSALEPDSSDEKEPLSMYLNVPAGVPKYPRRTF